jgi:hypothetical protein
MVLLGIGRRLNIEADCEAEDGEGVRSGRRSGALRDVDAS